MGTRGFVAFVVDGVEKVAYNHFDSYPGGLGEDVRSWLSSIVEHDEPLDGEATEILRSSVRALRVVDPQSTPTAEDVERLREFANLNVGRQSVDDWYVLLRETQGNPRLMLAAGVIEDASHFPADSLFAEWGYVVDLDAGTFEAYRGFQKAPHDKGRFANRPPDPESQGYYPVALAASWPLEVLPSAEEFIATLEPDEDAS